MGGGDGGLGITFRVQSVRFALFITHCSSELERFVETTHSPALTPYVQKISQAKARMERSQQVVQTIKTRIAKLERQYAR